jgi:hypothetical protein
MYVCKKQIDMKTKLFLFLMIALATLTQCKKDGDDDNSGDLTTDIVGRYDNDDDYTIVVYRVDDNTVSISIVDGGFSIAFTDVTMQSKTSFTLNEFSETINNSPNDNKYTYSGQGTNSANNISVTVKTVTDYLSDGVIDEEFNETYIATKIN